MSRHNAGVSSTLSCRPIEQRDWVAVHDWARLPESCRYQAWGPNTEAETKAFVDNAVAGWDAEPVRDRVYIAESGPTIVGTGVLHIRSRAHERGEIAYVIHPRRWGAGLGTAVAAELLHIGFTELGLHRIAATCDPRNLASAAVLTKLGMRCEGLMRDTMRTAEGWRDSQLYAILAPEWAMRQRSHT